MKNYFLPLSLILVSSLLYSQDPGFSEINGNNIKTGMHSNGSMFSDESLTNGNFLVPYELGQANASTIFGGGIWLSGIDPSGNLKVSFISYSNFSQEYSPGLIDGSILGDEANTVWKVTESEIRTQIEDFEDGTIDNQPSENLLQWPAKGNNYYTPALPTDIELAPFFDADNNGSYNPLLGDYPIIGNDEIDVIPAEMLYTIYNSIHPSFQSPPEVEVHALMYSFSCTDEDVLNNTVFTRHKFVHRGSFPLSNFKFSLWQDSDLGCYTDDFVGCDTLLNSFFTYNQDPIDGTNGETCQGGVNTYGDNPPVHSTVFLNHLQPFKIQHQDLNIIKI